MTEENKNFRDIIALQQKHFIGLEGNINRALAAMTGWGNFGVFARQKMKIDLVAIEKETRILIDKFGRIPVAFLEVFDQKSYLKANADVEKAVESGTLDSALEHFVFFGYEEVRSGKRRIGTVFPYYRENDYLRLNPNIAKQVESGVFALGYEHFLESGYIGFLKKERRLGGRCPSGWNDELVKSFKPLFDAEAYLEANPDVVKAINAGKFNSAWEHFDRFGAEEVRRADRQLYLKIPMMFESDYVMRNPDIFHAFYAQEIDSVFKHFLLHGVSEILAGKRAAA